MGNDDIPRRFGFCGVAGKINNPVLHQIISSNFFKGSAALYEASSSAGQVL